MHRPSVPATVRRSPFRHREADDYAVQGVGTAVCRRSSESVRVRMGRVPSGAVTRETSEDARPCSGSGCRATPWWRRCLQQTHREAEVPARVGDLVGQFDRCDGSEVAAGQPETVLVGGQQDAIVVQEAAVEVYAVTPAERREAFRSRIVWDLSDLPAEYVGRLRATAEQHLAERKGGEAARDARAS